MRALFGFNPARGPEMAEQFERALGYWGRAYAAQMLRGPGSPYRSMVRAKAWLDEVIFAEIDRRLESGERGSDLLSLLMDATDKDGSRLSKQELRDQVMTLLFAGHDTTTSTVTFLFYELARNPGRPRSRPGHRRDTPHVSPGVDRAAALDRGLRATRPANARAECS